MLREHYGRRGGRATTFLLLPVVRRFVAVVLTAVLAFPAGAASKGKTPKAPKPPDASRIEGRIHGGDGKAIPDAIVTVRALDGDKTWSSAPSDRKGRFRIEHVAYGWADIVIKTADGEFLGDQAMTFPPGKKIEVTFTLVPTADKPESWWADRRIERPAGVEVAQLGGLAQSSQKLTGVEYWKSPAGIAILAGSAVLALGLIAAGGRGYTAP